MSYCAAAGLHARAAERASTALISRQTLEEPPPDGQAAGATLDVIGRIEIPGLALSAPITAGVDRIDLIEGVGHIPGTAVAGGLGTMGLAGHRDTFFRGLRHITPGMQIRISGHEGSYRYQVDSVQIVSPEQVEVLETGSRPKLVLVTCYPFSYMGAAPRRFIVQAHLLSLNPEAE